MEEELQRLILIGKRTPVIKKMWVFGSRHKNSNRRDSDLDIAVEVEWIKG
jgi:predicted nucleotidyltransferase